MATGEVSVDATIRWKIPEIVSAAERSSYFFPLRSPKFSFASSSWCLRMFRDSEYKWIGLFLYLESTAVRKTVDFGLYLEKINGEKYRKLTFKYRTFDEPSGGGCRQFVTLQELRDKEKGLVRAGALTVVCHMKESKSSTSEELLSLDTLSSDFQKLFAIKEACDVCLRVQNKEFQCHRAILTARSSVFAAMFKNDTSERESGVVTIPDCDPDTFEDFLKYLYTGSVKKISSEEARHLYVTADKYDVKELRTFCVTSMTESMAVENVCDVVILADLYKDKYLLSSCQTFFKRNFKEVISSAEWKNLMKTNYNMASEMLEKMASTVTITDNEI